MPSALDAIVELTEVVEGDTPELGVRIDQWPASGRVYRWSMPYWVDCDGGARVYEPAKAVITGEIAFSEQEFALERTEGRVFGSVVGADEADALEQVRAQATSKVFAMEDVEGLLYSASGAEPACEPGC
ncbi:MAG: hypothetical protein JNK82_05795 [Myxococcaceae bacterium]|nr:hypothetical protein [Myxococcaceae bacterium]